jgi:hypothetical protein
MRQIISGWMKPKFNASNVEFVLSLTLHVDVGSVAWCIRHLADAEIPSCVSSVDRFQNGTYVVYAVSVIAFIGITKAALSLLRSLIVITVFCAVSAALLLLLTLHAYVSVAITCIGIYLHVSRSASVVGHHCLNYELRALEPSPNFITSVR